MLFSTNFLKESERNRIDKEKNINSFLLYLLLSTFLGQVSMWICSELHRWDLNPGAFGFPLGQSILHCTPLDQLCILSTPFTVQRKSLPSWYYMVNCPVASNSSFASTHFSLICLHSYLRHTLTLHANSNMEKKQALYKFVGILCRC